MDYVLPGLGDLPDDFRLSHMETPTRFNLFGMRDAGEGGCTGAHAAVASAVADALREYKIGMDGSSPFTPTWVVDALSRPLCGSGEVQAQ
jgi:CO/xanthine dehydrogenase Mo-binding subunit